MTILFTRLAMHGNLTVVIRMAIAKQLFNVLFCKTKSK